MRTCVKWGGIAFIASSLFALSACYAPSTLRPQVSGMELAAEERIQQQMIDEAAQTGGHPRPWRKTKGMTKRFEAVAERLEPVAAKMCQEMGLPKLKRRCYFYFKLKIGDEINAYADGDTIFFTYGIMRFFENDDELAFVMAHEIAHNLMGHRKAKIENVKVGYLIGKMLDEAAGYNAGWAGDSVEMGALAYSQSFEAEADYVGLYIAARAGYNIRKAPNYWRRLSIESPEALYIATTHPTNPERFAMMQKTIQEIAYKKKHRMALLPEMAGQPIEGDYETKNIIDTMFK